jgi:predicted NBD/HSP70 family sugar kinase
MSTAVAVAAASGSGAGAVLQLFRDGRAWTRAEIIEATGLARSTVGLRLDTLLESGLVVPVADSVSTGGRPPTRFRFDPRARVVIGADVGATHARLAVTALDGEVLAEHTEDIQISDGPDQVLRWLVRSSKSLLRKAGRRPADLLGVGIGLPGPVEHSTGRPANPPIMPGWDGFDVPGTVGAGLGCPVLVDNDVNVMALGERVLGESGRDERLDNMVFVKVATGIGAGIISEGRLHRGAQGAAGDLGHVQAPHGGDAPCRCGNTGCLEAIASGPAVAARLAAQGLDARTGRDVVDLVRGGNLPATQALRQAGRDLGEVLASTVSLLNPSVIVVGGLMVEAGESLLAGVREVVYARSLPLATGQLRIVASTAGPMAGVLGAAILVVEDLLSPEQVDLRLAAART